MLFALQAINSTRVRDGLAVRLPLVVRHCGERLRPVEVLVFAMCRAGKPPQSPIAEDSEWNTTSP